MRTLTEIVDATRQAFMENLTLQQIYALDPARPWNDQFSLVSLESLLTYVFSYCIFVYETIVYTKADELVALVDSKKLFTIPWYSNIAKAFQLGDDLVYDETTYQHGYAVIDATKQIVKYVAVRQRQVDGVTKLQVYVAKAAKAALSVSELAAFSAYIAQMGAAGMHFQFISLAPDELTLNLTVYYNAQVLNANGEKLADGTKPVDLAIADYLNNILYTGKFNRTKQTDAIQAAEGVMDVVLGNVLLNDDLNNNQEFESASGFYEATTINVTYERYAD